MNPAVVIPQGPPDPKARCRVCSGWGMQLVPFSSGSYPNEQIACTLPDAIVAVGGVQIQADDGLPQYCCVYCVRQVEAAYRLRQLCQEADRALREMFRVAEKEEEEEEANAEQLVQIKVEGDPLEMEQPESLAEEIGTNEGASSSQHQEFLVKEELDIEDYGDGFVDEENSMEQEESAGEADNDTFYDRVPVEKFCCCGCKQTFDTKDELLAHRDEVHIARKLTKDQLKCRAQCDICYKILNNSGAALRRHRGRSGFEYRCKMCGERFMNRVRVTNHFKLKHELPAREEIICCGCETQFNSKEELAAHSETVHLPKRSPPDEKFNIVCEVCYAKFATQRGLFNHQTRLTKEAQKFSCKDCGKSFRYAYNLQQHEKTHWKTDCHLCPVKETSHAAYLKHMEAHRMPDKTIKCLLCGQCYKYPQTLRIHYQSHAGERPFSCPKCPRTFLRKLQLTDHIKVHLGQRDHACQLCDAKFTHPTNLSRHVKFHHFKERPLTCLFCTKTFQKGNDRKRHMLLKHPDELSAKSEAGESKVGSVKQEGGEGQRM